VRAHSQPLSDECGEVTFELASAPRRVIAC